MQEVYPGGMVILHDGAPAHSARATQDLLRNHNQTIESHPAESPDINIIETVFGLVKRKVRNGERITDTIILTGICSQSDDPRRVGGLHQSSLGGDCHSELLQEANSVHAEETQGSDTGKRSTNTFLSLNVTDFP